MSKDKKEVDPNDGFWEEAKSRGRGSKGPPKQNHKEKDPNKIEIKNWINAPYDLDLRDVFNIAKEASEESHHVAFLKGIEEIEPYGCVVVWYTGTNKTNEEIKKAFLEAWNEES